MGFIFLLFKGIMLVVFIFAAIFVASFFMALFGIIYLAFFGGFFTFLLGFLLLGFFSSFHLFSLILMLVVCLLLISSIRLMVKARIHEKYLNNKKDK